MTRFFRPRRPVRVLLVEDNDSYAETLQLLLAGSERIDVVGRACDGAEGCALARALEPDCILMDISMPVMDGLTATERLMQDGLATRIVVLTSSDDPEDRARALQAGAAAYLTKESPLDDLVAAVTAGEEREDRQPRSAGRRGFARGMTAPLLPT